MLFFTNHFINVLVLIMLSIFCFGAYYVALKNNENRQLMMNEADAINAYVQLAEDYKRLQDEYNKVKSENEFFKFKNPYIKK